MPSNRLKTLRASGSKSMVIPYLFDLVLIFLAGRSTVLSRALCLPFLRLISQQLVATYVEASFQGVWSWRVRNFFGGFLTRSSRSRRQCCYLETVPYGCLRQLSHP